MTVERSAALRDAQHELLALEPFEDALGPAVHEEPDEAPHPVPGVGPIVGALAELPAVPLRHGVVLANELLDNLPFRIVERGDAGWLEIARGRGRRRPLRRGGACQRCRRARGRGRSGRGRRGRGPGGARLPVPGATDDWLAAAARTLAVGPALLVDYADTAASMAARGQREWLRTYREHQRGHRPARRPGFTGHHV